MAVGLSSTAVGLSSLIPQTVGLSSLGGYKTQLKKKRSFSLVFSYKRRGVKIEEKQFELLNRLNPPTKPTINPPIFSCRPSFLSARFLEKKSAKVPSNGRSSSLSFTKQTLALKTGNDTIRQHKGEANNFQGATWCDQTNISQNLAKPINAGSSCHWLYVAAPFF